MLINHLFRQTKRTRNLLERAMDVSSAELNQPKEKILQVSNRQQAILEKLQTILLSMQPAMGDASNNTDRLQQNPEYLVDLLEQQVEKTLLLQEKLRQSEEKLQYISDILPGAIYRFRTDMEGKTIPLFISKGISDLFGFSSEQAMENFQLLRSCIFPEDLIRSQNDMRVSMQTNCPYQGEFRIRTPSGQVRWISGHSVPAWDSQENAIVWNGIFTDITPLKAIEVELCRAKEVVEQATIGEHKKTWGG